MRRSLSPTVFHRRSRSGSTELPVGQILFPKAFEDEWELADITNSNTDFEKARFFMVRFANQSPDQRMASEVISIVASLRHRTVVAMALVFRTRMFADRHVTFDTSPLLQCIRFILIKTRIPEVMVSDKIKTVLDFYFDPSIASTRPPSLLCATNTPQHD